MLIQVAMVPRVLPTAPADSGVCIVIDVLRATSTLTTLVGYGAARVLVAPGAEAAREARRRDPGALLIGEIGGLRPEDFDFGNSPREYSPAVIADRRAICHTSNGTAAIRSVAAAPLTLLGCLRNAGAVAALAFDAAREGDLPVTIVCSGGDGGRIFALDDTLVAGQLALLLRDRAERAGVPVAEDDATAAACTLRRAELGPDLSPPAAAWEAALRRTVAGRHLAQIGLGDDIPFCADPDRTDLVPVARLVDGAVVVSPHARPGAGAA